MNEESPRKPDRRRLLRIGGVLAVGATVTGGECALSHRQELIYAQASRSNVPPPPLEVLVYTKAAFGAKPGDLERFRALPGNPEAKLKTWVEGQLDPSKIDDKACEARLAAAKFESLGKPLERLWKEYYRDVAEGDEKYTRIYQPVRETQLSTLLRAIHSRRQLYEVMVGFWHDHFNVAPERDERIAPGFASYDRDVIRKHALGNFRQFLEAVATHPAMLYYLDNASSSRSGPNENWSRELFELHTLGAENYLGVKRQREVRGFAQGQPVGYVDDDVYETTRAFTGWRVDDDPDEPGLTGSGKFIFYSPWHDRFQKTVLGRLLPPDQGPMQNGKDVLDALAEHPGTARFIARKLVRKFIADNPPEGVVALAAKVFYEGRKAPDQIAQTVRVILLTPEFRNTWGQKIKRPLEVGVGVLRALDTDLEDTPDNLWLFDWMGQPLFGHKPPDGFPDRRESWNSTTHMFRRWQFGIGASSGWFDKIKKVDWPRVTPSRKPNEIVDFWTRRILGRPVSASTREQILKFLTWGEDANKALEDKVFAERVPLAVGMIFATPDFHWR